MADLSLRQPELRTERLCLRPLRPADAALIALYASDARVACMTTSIPHPYPPGAAEAMVARANAAGTRETVWALDTGDEDGNGLIGLIDLKPTGADAAEIGFWVAPAFWNSGYAAEAVEAVAAHAAESGLAALDAKVFQDNSASVKVLERTEFTLVGAGDAYSLARGAMVPTFRYRRMLEGER